MLIKLHQQAAVELHHGIFRQAAAEPGEGRMVRRGLIQRKTQKRFKGDAVIDLALKLGVRGDLKPFLKQQAFKEQQRWVGLAAFGALAGGIRAIEQLVDRFPVDGKVQLFEQGHGAVFIGESFNSQVGKRKVELGISVSHDASEVGWELRL
jgi:hypothetical protein